MPCNAYDDMAVLVFKHPGCYNPPLAMAEGGATDLVVDRATPAAAARGAGHSSPAAPTWWWSWLVLAAAGFVAWRREARVAAAGLFFFIFFEKKFAECFWTFGNVFAECATKNIRQTSVCRRSSCIL